MHQRKHFYRRFLPHFQKEDCALFITFSTWKRWILPEVARDLALEACLHVNNRKCTLHVAVIMPDHVHLILSPMRDEHGFISIPEIMKAIKSESAHRINKALGRTGRVWQDESFDHVLRRSESLEQKIAYIMENPIRAGLVHNSRDYKWLWKRTAILPLSA